MRRRHPQDRARGRTHDVLDALYRIPQPFRTYEDWMRFSQKDLEEMSDSALQREWERLRYRLTVDDHPDPWLLKRHQALCEILR